MCDEANDHSLECDKVYDLCEYPQDKLDNLHEKHFLHTENMTQSIDLYELFSMIIVQNWNFFLSIILSNQTYIFITVN